MDPGKNPIPSFRPWSKRPTFPAMALSPACGGEGRDEGGLSASLSLWKRPLTGLAAQRAVAPVAGPLGLELLDCRERVLAHARALERLGGFDHLVEDRGDRGGLVAVGALEHGEQIAAARRIAGERVFGHAA